MDWQILDPDGSKYYPIDVVAITKRKQKDKEMVVTEGIEGTLPTTKIICSKCKHNEATFYLRQTRAADEPTTRFYQCTKCKHRWREY